MLVRIRLGVFVACLLSLALSAPVGAQDTGGRREPSQPSGSGQPSRPKEQAKPRPPDKPDKPDEPHSPPPPPSAQPRPMAQPGRPSTKGGQLVFVGGYFYDPFFGAYPWWTRPVYPYPYFPVYDLRARVRVMAKPNDAAVYVDGFYAGISDDFDNAFQSLPLSPGGHEITLYLEGYRTVRWRLYLRPGSTLKLLETLEPLPAGVRSEPPFLAAPVPPPPPGTFVPPRTKSRDQPRPPSTSATPLQQAVGYGSFALRVQPADAAVLIDGERWVSSDKGQFILQVSVGPHRVEITKPGYRRFSTEIQMREGEETPLNVSLSLEQR